MCFGKILSMALLLCCWAVPAFAGQEIVINGSTTVLPIMQKAGENFMSSHPDIVLHLSGDGSGNGLKALAEKQCDVAMSSRDLKGKEKHVATRNGVEPIRTTIALDAIVPVVNPANGVSGLSMAQLRDIFAGRIVNWKEVGGADANIVIVSRDTSSGTFEGWDDLVMHKTRVSPAALMQASNGAVVQAVANNRNALGYIGLGYLNTSVKGLAVNGVAPCAASTLDGLWPIARELYIFTNGQPAGAVRELLDYLLARDKGQQDVLEMGFVPVAR